MLYYLYQRRALLMMEKILKPSVEEETMPKRAHQSLRPYFYVGHKVRIQPDPALRFTILQGYHATVTRIEQIPAPAWLDLRTPEEQSKALRTRRVTFWVKVDDPTGLDDLIKRDEYVCWYRELRPLSPRMTPQQLEDYCWQCFHRESEYFRKDAYRQILKSLRGSLSEIDCLSCPREGYEVDLINRLLSAAARMRSFSSPPRDYDERKAQVWEEVAQLLIPKQYPLLLKQQATMERRLKQHTRSSLGSR